MTSDTRAAHLPALDEHQRRETASELHATLVELVDLSVTIRYSNRAGQSLVLS